MIKQSDFEDKIKGCDYRFAKSESGKEAAASCYELAKQMAIEFADYVARTSNSKDFFEQWHNHPPVFSESGERLYFDNEGRMIKTQPQ